MAGLVIRPARQPPAPPRPCCVASPSVAGSGSARLTCNQGSSPPARHNFTQEPWNEAERPRQNPATGILFQPPSDGGAEAWLAFQAFPGVAVYGDLKLCIDLAPHATVKELTTMQKFHYLWREKIIHTFNYYEYKTHFCSKHGIPKLSQQKI